MEHQDCVVGFSIAASSLCGGLSQFAILHQVLYFYYLQDMLDIFESAIYCVKHHYSVRGFATVLC